MRGMPWTWTFPEVPCYAGKMRALIAIFGVALVLSGCVNPHRAPCLKACSSEKDSCMLNASTAEEIQKCDGLSSTCSAGCPR